MRTTRKAAPFVIAAALTLGVVGLTGCSTSPAAVAPVKAVKAVKAAPTKAATPTKTLEPGSIAVKGYPAANVATAARFVERFSLAAMGSCSPDSLPVLQSMMTPALYESALKSKTFLLVFDPPFVMSPGCVTSQKLSDGHVSGGRVWDGIPTVRVAVTVTQGVMVGTKSSPKTLKSYTAIRRYTVDVLPSGKSWRAQSVTTGDTTVTDGK